MRKGVDEMRFGKGLCPVDPADILDRGETAEAAAPERIIDHLAFGHIESGMRRAEALGQRASDGTRSMGFARRLDQLRAKGQVCMAVRGVEIVVLDEHRRRQHDIGVARRLPS